MRVSVFQCVSFVCSMYCISRCKNTFLIVVRNLLHKIQTTIEHTCHTPRNTIFRHKTKETHIEIHTHGSANCEHRMNKVYIFNV